MSYKSVSSRRPSGRLPDGVLLQRFGAFPFWHCSFLLQNFYVEQLAHNLMMHLLVESADDWHEHVSAQGLVERFGIQLGAPEDRSWAMRDFTLIDPSGVLWRIGQNIARTGS